MELPGSGTQPTSPKATQEPSLASPRALVDLCLACSRCTPHLSESTYLRSRVEHSCACDILLARLKRAAESSVWRKVDRPPSFPQPARCEVCRYYSPGLGCRHHHNQCTFARSPKGALVWPFELEHNVGHLWVKVGAQSGVAQGKPLAPADAILAEFGGHFQTLCSPCFQRRPPGICPVEPHS
ncbi:3'-5' exoribonuclease HELZ2-like [Camelus bactrianus]|uniref:3'-5' exoribonuclease HELZ2-like n=1 Tax=Camelus bactrianus TaxID=9837 RepID=A0AC58P161_CAMBA